MLIRSLFRPFVAFDGNEAGGGGGTDAGDGGGTPKTFTQEELDRVVGDRLARQRSQFADYDALKQKASKYDEVEAASKSDLERVTGERDTLKSTADTTTAENLRLRVAMEKKVPAEMIDRLRGSTKEELEADADELLKLVQAPATSFDRGRRGDAAAGQTPDQLIRRMAGRGAR